MKKAFPVFMEAKGFLGRFKGYMLLSESRINSALLFRNCWALHTFFMRFKLDMFFLDEMGKVIRVERLVSPWGFRYFSKAAHVIEVPSGHLVELGFGHVCVGYKFDINA